MKKINNWQNIKNNLVGVYIIWYREVLIYVRNKVKFFTSIFFPLLLLIFFGTGLENIFSITNLSYGFKEFFFPGIIGASVVTLAITSTMSVVWDREFGFLKEILVSPISRISIALGKILGATTAALIEGILLLLTAPFLGFDFTLPLYLINFFIIFVVALGMSSLGLIIASRIRKTESFNVILQIFIAPMIFLSGAFFPLNNGPSWMLKLASYNPLAYGINALRWAMLSSTVSYEAIKKITTTNFAVSFTNCILFDIIITLIAIYFFRKIR